MKNLAKSLTALLLAAMMVAALGACSGGGDASSPTPAPAASGGGDNGGGGGGNDDTGGSSGSAVSDPGVFPIVSEKVTLKVAVRGNDYIGDFATNKFAEWYEEKTNVHVEWIELPNDPGQLTERVNLMMLNESELPDVFMLSAVEPNINGARGTYIALNDLIDKQGVETKKVFAENSDVLPGLVTSVDGNIYSLPNIDVAYHSAHAVKAYIDQAWLDKLGLAYPKTTADFEAVLKAFKDNDPNGDGSADEIPMTGAADGWNTTIYPFLLNSFVPYYDPAYNGSGYTYNNNGKLEFVANTEDFRDGLRYIKSLVDQGLIEKSALTQTNTELQGVGYSQDGVTHIGAFTAGLWATVVPMGDGGAGDYGVPFFTDRSREYVGLSPLEGPKGVRVSPLTGTGVTSGFDTAAITKVCKTPEVAFKWIDGLYNYDVTLNSQIGFERSEPAAGVNGINGQPAAYVQKGYSTAEEVAAANAHMVNAVIANRTSDFRLSEALDTSDPNAAWGMEPRLYTMTKEYFVPFAKDETAVPPLNFTDSEDSTRANLYTQIKDYVQESIVLFILGDKDVENGWDAYVKEFDALKLNDYMNILQTAYDRQYK